MDNGRRNIIAATAVLLGLASCTTIQPQSDSHEAPILTRRRSRF